MSKRRRPTFSRRRRPAWPARIFVVLALVTLAVATWMVLGAALSDSSTEEKAQPSRSVVLLDGQRRLGRVDVPAETSAAARARVVRRVAALVPSRAIRRHGRARIEYRYDRAASARRVLDAAVAGVSTALVFRHPVSATIAADVVAQEQRNTCESAALSILLSSIGKSVPQGRLQEMLPKSGPLDPSGDGPDRVWGDPDRGFVGRPDGGGQAGGFGVYPGPIARVAQRVGVRLADLTGAEPRDVYERLLGGRAVMVWIGLSDGPYGEWSTPSGKRIRVNFGEHTVVLRGIRSDGRLEVVNPLDGTEEIWTASQFELLWNRLDRRALST